MTRCTRSSSRPAGRLFVLLVLAVLAGVLGMHGLAPGAAVAAQAGAGHEVAMASADGVARADGGCSHTDGGSGHLDHADATCAATGTGSPYTPPALTVGMALPTPAATGPVTAPSGSSHDGRAPPDLSELQLLRI
ncbi:DUF6153 family protein [Streptomyces sp. NPDC001046]|uniref:DUF6153 family protein n=1 Tax=Streptomyces sp. NPDC001046 TaxID=3364543 RepID=UPI00368DE39A